MPFTIGNAANQGREEVHQVRGDTVHRSDPQRLAVGVG